MLSRLSGALLIASMATCPVIAQEDAASSFNKKSMTMIIGNTAGGTYDLYGRLVARFLGKFIPGNPTIVPENMPGAGTIRAANHLYNVAPRDGTVLGIVAETVAVEQAVGNAAVRYDAANFTWVGRLVSSAGVHIIWSKSKAHTFEDLKRYEVLTAGTGAGNVAETVPMLMNALLGTKFKLVRGYPSATEAMLAIERGEVEGTAVNWTSMRTVRADWVRDQKIRVLFQYLGARNSKLPDAPALGELGETEEAKQLFRLYGSMGDIGRSIFAAPGVPPANAKILREAFNAMMLNPDFIAEANRLGAELEPATGEELQSWITKTLQVPSSAVEKAKTIFAR